MATSVAALSADEPVAHDLDLILSHQCRGVSGAIDLHHRYALPEAVGEHRIECDVDLLYLEAHVVLHALDHLA